MKRAVGSFFVNKAIQWMINFDKEIKRRDIKQKIKKLLKKIKNLIDKYYKIFYNKCTYNKKEEVQWNLVLV